MHIQAVDLLVALLYFLFLLLDLLQSFFPVVLLHVYLEFGYFDALLELRNFVRQLALLRHHVRNTHAVLHVVIGVFGLEAPLAEALELYLIPLYRFVHVVLQHILLVGEVLYLLALLLDLRVDVL